MSLVHLVIQGQMVKPSQLSEQLTPAKSILTKCKADGSNFWRAILDWRNTPTESVGSSPSQRLMSRRTRTCLPIASRMLRPRVVTGVQHKLVNKSHIAKKH